MNTLPDLVEFMLAEAGFIITTGSPPYVGGYHLTSNTTVHFYYKEKNMLQLWVQIIHANPKSIQKYANLMRGLVSEQPHHERFDTTSWM